MIITAQELRIGNVIQSGKGMYRIYALSFPMILAIQSLKSDIQSEEGIFSSASTIIEPIELSEEILFKIGFEKEDMEDLGSSIYTPISEDSDYCLSWVNESIYIEECKIPIKNLHQLQNLYFALTGEELDVSKLI